MENGTLQIGYGDDEEITIDTMQDVTWYEDGVLYEVLNSNYTDVTKEQMLKMAEDIINS